MFILAIVLFVGSLQKRPRAWAIRPWNWPGKELFLRRGRSLIVPEIAALMSTSALGRRHAAALG
jgi:hypothetical protein